MIIIKSPPREISVWVYWMYNWICVLDSNALNDQRCTGIHPALLTSAESLKQRTKTTQPRRQASNLNNKKYIDRRSNALSLARKSWMSVKTRVSVAYLQPKFYEKQNDYWTQTLLAIFSCGIELKKKNKLLLEKIELTHFLRQYTLKKEDWK